MILTDKPMEEMNEGELSRVEFMKTLASVFKGLVEADFNSNNIEVDFRSSSKFAKTANVFFARFNISKKNGDKKVQGEISKIKQQINKIKKEVEENKE